jgi:hypothetical protein
MNDHKNDLLKLKSEKEGLQEKLKSRTKDVRESLLQELQKVEEDMNKHFGTQKNENLKLVQHIISLKTEKTSLQNQLIALQRRISDLEMQVGNDDVK